MASSDKFDSLKLYSEFFVDKDFERFDLFKLLAEKYGIKSALYPGSFVHITPSFVFPITAYIDQDRRARRFFEDPNVHIFVSRQKIYESEADVSFYSGDYRENLELKNKSFELLISQYAGFISHYCKRHLKPGGFLLANNSHGDAILASIDDDYELIAAVTRSKGKYRITEKNLQSLFCSKIRKDHNAGIY